MDKTTEINERAETMVEVVDIQFRPGQKIYFFDPNQISCKPGDHLIIDTARGAEFGYCTAGNHKIRQRDLVTSLRPVLRKATARDEQVAEANRAIEQKAFEICLEQIRTLELDMQLVSAECAFDGSKVLFFFTADERVDFRELVKNLAANFHTRIELRQIGVRDKAKMVGGLGICGRPFCCASFLDDFQPVSIKMAKTQNLSLNPTKISGTCGRLMCCLKYEQEAYEDLIEHTPKLESFVDTPEGRGVVVEQSLLRSRVKVRMEDRPEQICTFKIDEIAVFRNGKAKKNDPPVPADWAPVSGTGKRAKREDDDRMMLDSIKFRYSTETIAEEQVVEPEKVKEEQHKSRNRRNKQKGGEKPKQEKPQPQQEKPKQEKIKQEKPKQEKQPAAEAEKMEKPAGEEQKKRRPYYHRRHHHKKPKQGE